MNEVVIILVALAAIGVFVAVLVSFRRAVRTTVDEQLSFVRLQEEKMLEVTTAISAEIQLLPLLEKIMETVTEILDADRSTLFIYDSRTSELWSNVAQGIGEGQQIRFPANSGIAGSVFTSGETVNIKDAYSDERFNKAIDKKTGYKTQSILCMQVRNKTGSPIGVCQVLNKRGGPFNGQDEARLAALSAQAAIAIENAQLFEEVNDMKNYNEAILESMTNGVLTLDAEGRVEKANAAALMLLRCADDPERLVGKKAADIFSGEDNRWVLDGMAKALESGESDEAHNEILALPDWSGSGDPETTTATVNLMTQPLTNSKGDRMGCLLVTEDMTNDRKLRSTMARYMTKEVADKLLEEGEDALGGTLQKATVLFSDIRSFTSLSERVGPQETVAMLNDYFTIMVDLIMSNKGILDKYIGDAIMAVFGAPFSTSNDADNALTTAIEMMRALDQFNAARITEGREPVHIGIGVNTDQILSGNIGSERRMDYTVIGDGVNLAARLETANKTFGTQVLFSEYTLADLTGEYRYREADRLRVKGKENAVSIYESLDVYPEARFPYMEQVLAAYNSGLNHYRGQDFKDAATQFEKALNLHPADSLSKLYRDRCTHFLATPPPEDWDGVWTMTTK
jgi:adenylate cyclase